MRWPLGRPWCGSGLWNAGIFQVSLNYYRHWNLINKQYDWCFTILIISWFCFSLYVMLNLLFEIWNIALYLNCKKGMENSKSKIVMFVCLGGVYRPTREFFTHMETSPLPVKAANFDLCSWPSLMAIEQWGFFNISHQLWHGPTLYTGLLRGPVTLKPVAERLAVELSLPVFTTQVYRERGSNPNLLHARRTLYLFATAAVSRKVKITTNFPPLLLNCNTGRN